MVRRSRPRAPPHKDARTTPRWGASVIARVGARTLVSAHSPRPSGVAMTQVQETESYTRGSTGWAGWVVFAATMLVLIGCLHMIQGLVALFDEGVMVTARKED